jgi:hypothetical protein
MGSESLIYSFIARDTVVLAEYTPFSGNFSTIAVQCLQKLPANNGKFIYSCDRHTFNYLVDDEFSMSPSFLSSPSVLPFWFVFFSPGSLLLSQATISKNNFLAAVQTVSQFVFFCSLWFLSFLLGLGFL